MSSSKPGKYVPPSSRATLKKAETNITEIKSEDFPEFIPVSLPKATNTISQKPSYASLLKPKVPVIELDTPIIVNPSVVRKVRLVDMGESPCKDTDHYLPHTLNFSKYFKLRKERLQKEEKRRNARAYDHSSDEEKYDDQYLPEDNLSEIYDQDDDDDDDESQDNYDPSEYDRHK
jgi:hypothetical protein